MEKLADQHRQLVQQSFGRVADESMTISHRFYERLFAREPMVRAMFQPDMTAQQEKFFQMVGMMVAALNDEEALAALLHNLGKIHANYGVSQAHFDQGEDALVGAFGDALEDAFTPEVEAAWRATYRYLVGIATDIPEYSGD